MNADAPRKMCIRDRFYSLSDLSATAFKLDIAATLRIGFLEIVFVFLFIDMFDNIGTLLAVGKKAGLFDQAHRIPRVNRILLSDATATVVGSLAGTCLLYTSRCV